MPVDKNFFTTINELTNRSVTGEITTPVDPATWITYGKQMADLDGQTLANGFLKNLLNRIKATVDTYRTYTGKFLGIYRDTTNFGAVQMYMKHFYEARKAPFIGLKSGDTFPFTVYLPDEDVQYFIDTTAKQIPITIQTTELKGAFETPERMDSFIRHIFGNVANSLELQREQARRGLVVNGARDIITNHNINRNVSTKIGVPVQIYNLGKMYLAEHPDEFKTSTPPTNNYEQWLSNPNFVRYAVSVIQAAGTAMREVTTGFNSKGVKTFSAKTHVVTAQPFKSAVTVTAMNTFHDDYLLDGMSGEVVAWWEDSAEPLYITAPNSTEFLKESGFASAESETTPIPVIAMMYDEFTFGEFVDLENTTSQYNGEVDATNYYYNDARKYVYNESAPLAIFTLGYGPKSE